MMKFTSMLQIFGAMLLYAVALATVVNLLLIATRPETISVVNAVIGLGVIAICFLALGRILWRKGLAGLRAARDINPAQNGEKRV